jgi:hypothetical protein
MLDARLILEISPTDVREKVSMVDLRDDITRDDRSVESEARDFRNTVCGTTANFCSSTSPVVRMFFSASGSRLNLDPKLKRKKSDGKQRKNLADQPRYRTRQFQNVISHG